MISVATGVLTLIGQAILSAIAKKVTDEAWARLQTDAAKTALKQAIGAAVSRYATGGTRLTLARPLLEAGGVLTDPAVAAELAQVVRFDREPDAELIGRKWKTALQESMPAQWLNYNFTEEA